MFVASVKTVDGTSLVTSVVSKVPLGFGAEILYTYKIPLHINGISGGLKCTREKFFFIITLRRGKVWGRRKLALFNVKKRLLLFGMCTCKYMYDF